MKSNHILIFSLILTSLIFGAAASAFAAEGVDLDEEKIPTCKDSGSSYYSIDLVTTKNIPGTGQAKGKAVMKFDGSPFGISVTKDGFYRHRLDIQLENIKNPKDGRFVAWVTTPSLDQTKLIGSLDQEYLVSGEVSWNKYIVVITLEESTPENGQIWQGPIAFRGMSRSGLMHTMAGHGPFEQEPCAKYGYY